MRDAQLVLETHDPLHGSGIPLTGTAASELTIDALRVVPLRGDHQEAAEVGNPGAETATSNFTTEGGVSATSSPTPIDTRPPGVTILSRADGRFRKHHRFAVARGG